jgi:hypothetical protein
MEAAAMETASASKPQSDEQVRLADRRHKARERQRRLQAETPQRSWWTSHAPLIALGFCAALVLTIYLARSNRHAQRLADQAAWEPEVPELNIEGPPSAEFDAKEAPAIPSVAAANVAPEAPPTTLDRSPPLLAAKPQVQPAPAPEESVAPTEEAEVSAAEYPATDPTAHRPGGRIPRTARSSEPAPNYPSTTAPNTWR